MLTIIAAAPKLPAAEAPGSSGFAVTNEPTAICAMPGALTTLGKRAGRGA